MRFDAAGEVDEGDVGHFGFCCGVLREPYLPCRWSGIAALFLKKAVCCAAHRLALRYPVPDEELLFLGSMRERMTSIPLNGSEYLQAAESAAASGAASGGIYDALIGQCFLKSQAEVLYTWSLKHFLRLGWAVSGRVRSPNG
jgi:hypothetical protein